MAKLLWVWVALVTCICSTAGPVSAQALGAAEPPRACVIEHDPAPGIGRRDRFAPGEVVLTFDDGPQPLATKKLLDLLERHHLPATFFIVGLWVRDDTFHLIQRMVASGHELGTHTYGHDLELTQRGWGVDYVIGQYELTHVLVELALLARTPQEFRELYERVLERKPGQPLSPAQVRTRWRQIQRNHFELLLERDFSPERRPYAMLYARPPGGIPYEGNWPASQRREHEQALRQLGMLNVLWHGISGDAVPGRLNDSQFLLDNLRHHSRRGGVLLMHDRMRPDALKTALERMARDSKLAIRSLREKVAQKYACETERLYAELQPGRMLAARAADYGAGNSP